MAEQRRRITGGGTDDEHLLALLHGQRIEQARGGERHVERATGSERHGLVEIGDFRAIGGHELFACHFAHRGHDLRIGYRVGPQLVRNHGTTHRFKIRFGHNYFQIAQPL